MAAARFYFAWGCFRHFGFGANPPGPSGDPDAGLMTKK
jgi:hypothetical protein